MSQHVRYIVDVPAGHGDLSLAILDLIEPGSSGHTLMTGTEPAGVRTIAHSRLNVRISRHEVRETDYDEVTDCPICPMVATDRDDALAEVEELRAQLAAAWADADQLAAAFHENITINATVSEGLRCLDAIKAHREAVAARSTQDLAGQTHGNADAPPPIVGEDALSPSSPATIAAEGGDEDATSAAPIAVGEPGLTSAGAGADPPNGTTPTAPTGDGVEP